MSYAPDHIDLTRRTATYIEKILKGAKPADLPVEQASKYQLVINLKTAKALHRRCSPAPTRSSNSNARSTGHVRHWSARSARPKRAHAVGRREGP